MSNDWSNAFNIVINPDTITIDCVSQNAQTGDNNYKICVDIGAGLNASNVADITQETILFNQLDTHFALTGTPIIINNNTLVTLNYRFGAHPATLPNSQQTQDHPTRLCFEISAPSSVTSVSLTFIAVWIPTENPSEPKQVTDAITFSLHPCGSIGTGGNGGGGQRLLAATHAPERC